LALGPPGEASPICAFSGSWRAFWPPSGAVGPNMAIGTWGRSSDCDPSRGAPPVAAALATVSPQLHLLGHGDDLQRFCSACGVHVSPSKRAQLRTFSDRSIFSFGIGTIGTNPLAIDRDCSPRRGGKKALAAEAEGGKAPLLPRSGIRRRRWTSLRDGGSRALAHGYAPRSTVAEG